jgi:hypothetical protein
VAALAESHPARDDRILAAERTLHGRFPSIGSKVAGAVRIELRGKLATLDVTKLKAVGFCGRPTYYATDMWCHDYGYSSGNEQPWTGWRTLGVHVFDSPQLRGHVTTGDVPVFWDC